MPFDFAWEGNPDKQLRLLSAARNRLADPNLWCQKHWRLGDRQCLVSTLRTFGRQMDMTRRVRREAYRSIIGGMPFRHTAAARLVEGFIRRAAPESYLIAFNDVWATHGTLRAAMDAAVLHRQEELAHAV